MSIVGFPSNSRTACGDESAKFGPKLLSKSICTNGCRPATSQGVLQSIGMHGGVESHWLHFGGDQVRVYVAVRAIRAGPIEQAAHSLRAHSLPVALKVIATTGAGRLRRRRRLVASCTGQIVRHRIVRQIIQLRVIHSDEIAG